MRNFFVCRPCFPCDIPTKQHMVAAYKLQLPQLLLIQSNLLSFVIVTIEMGLTSSRSLSFLLYYRGKGPSFFLFLFLLFFSGGLRGADWSNMWRSPNITPKNKQAWEETIQILMYHFPSAMVWIQTQNRNKNLLNIILEHLLDLTHQISARPD